MLDYAITTHFDGVEDVMEFYKALAERGVGFHPAFNSVLDMNDELHAICDDDRRIFSRLMRKTYNCCLSKHVNAYHLAAEAQGIELNELWKRVELCRMYL